MVHGVNQHTNSTSDSNSGGVPDSDNLPGSGGSCVKNNSTAPLLIEVCTIDCLQDIQLGHTLYSTLCYETMEEWIATTDGGFRRAYDDEDAHAFGGICSDICMFAGDPQCIPDIKSHSDEQDEGHFPFVDQQSKTVHLPPQTVKLLNEAEDFKRALSTKFTVEEVKMIIRLCLLYDSGAHSVCIVRSINDLGAQVEFSKLTPYTVKGFRTTDNPSHRLQGGIMYIPVKNHFTGDVTRYRTFVLVYPETPIAIVGSMAMTRGNGLMFFDNIDSNINADVFSILPKFTYNVDGDRKYSRDAWLSGKQGTVWHRVFCVLNKQLIATATREDQAATVFAGLPAHVSMEDARYLHVAPVAAMAIRPGTVQNHIQSSCASASLDVHTGESDDGLDDPMLAARLQRSTEVSVKRPLMPKRMNRRHKQLKPPNSALNKRLLEQLYSLVSFLQARHFELNGELSDSIGPINGTMECLAEYSFMEYEVLPEKSPVLNEDVYVTTNNLLPAAQDALALAERLQQCDSAVHGRWDHNLTCVVNNLEEYCYLCTRASDIDAPAQFISDDGDALDTTISQLRFSSGVLHSSPYMGESALFQPQIHCRTCGNHSTVCNGDPCQYECLNGCASGHPNPECDRHNAAAPTFVKVHPVSEPLFADHGDGFHPQVGSDTVSLAANTVNSASISLKPIAPIDLKIRRKVQMYLTAAADNLEGKILVHGCSFRDWIEHATHFEQSHLAELLETVHEQGDRTRKEMYRKKAHKFIRELASAIEARTASADLG